MATDANSSAGRPKPLGKIYKPVIFGDESNSTDTITYGLLAFGDERAAYYSEVAWNKVIKKFGADSRSKVHCRELFNKSSRDKSCWAHLSEEDSHNLVRALATSLKDSGVFCSIGVLHKETFPSLGILDGVDANGQEIRRIWRDPEFFALAFLPAALALRRKILDNITPYSLSMDPLTHTVKLFKTWKNIQVKRLITASGLIPKPFDEKPQLLDAADIFSYGAARALTNAPARNKDVCVEVYNLLCDVRADLWWTSDTSLTFALSESTAAPPKLFDLQMQPASKVAV